MSENILEVKNLFKSFPMPGGLLHAVDGVSLSLEEGCTLGIVGESGSGKTTLGRCILRLIEPDDGDIRYRGESILSLKKAEMRMLRREIQMVFQNPVSSLDPRLTVSQTLSEILRVSGVCRDKGAVEKRILTLMEMTGLEERLLNRYPHELDGGRCQRLGIARALAVKPKFIVCDEPVSALDVSIQAQVINMFEELQEKLGVAYLFIAHDLLVVRHISKNIAVMYLGHMVETAQADELMDHPIHPYTESLLSAVPIPDPKIARQKKRIMLEGNVPSPLNMPSGCPFRTRCRYATAKCAEECPELTDRGNGHRVACWNR